MSDPRAAEEVSMIDSATIDEAVDLLECAGWKGYAQAVREQRALVEKQRSTVDELYAALKGVVLVADRNTPEFDAARAAIAKAEVRPGRPSR